MKREFYTGYNAELKDRSRQLRKNMTRQERHLWYDFLRNYPIKSTVSAALIGLLPIFIAAVRILLSK